MYESAENICSLTLEEKNSPSQHQNQIHGSDYRCKYQRGVLCWQTQIKSLNKIQEKVILECQQTCQYSKMSLIRAQKADKKLIQAAEAVFSLSGLTE